MIPSLSSCIIVVCILCPAAPLPSSLELATRDSGRQFEPLNRTHLTAVFYVEPPWVLPCAVHYWISKNYSACPDGFLGLSANTFMFMADLMHFTFDVIQESEIGMPDNETGVWSGLLGRLANGTADVGINTPFITQLRTQLLDFMPILSFDRLAVLIKKPTPTVRFEMFLLPFNRNAWLCILGAIPAFALTAIFMTSVGNCAKHRKLKWGLAGMVSTVQCIVFAPVQKGGCTMKGHTFRHAIVSWQFVFYILSTVYSTALFSYLQESFRVQEPFLTRDEFTSSVASGDYSVIMTNGVYQFLHSLKLEESEYAALNSTFRMFNDFELELEVSQLVQTDENVALLDMQSVTDYFALHNCDTYSVHMDMNGHYSAFPTSKFYTESSKLAFFSPLLRSFYANAKKKRDERISQSGMCTDTGSTVERNVKGVTALTTGHLWPVFIICSTAMTAALLIFMLQLVCALVAQNKTYKIYI